MSWMTARLARTLLLLALLISAWVLWSGQFKPLLLVLGAFSCILAGYITHRMRYFDNDVFELHFGMRLFGYWAWLAREVGRSSIEVARVVMDPRLPISPHIVDIKASVDHPVDLAILGNSITLTPGTLALDVHDGIIKVHCLTRIGAEELLAGEMSRRVAALRQD